MRGSQDGMVERGPIVEMEVVEQTAVGWKGQSYVLDLSSLVRRASTNDVAHWKTSTINANATALAWGVNGRADLSKREIMNTGIQQTEIKRARTSRISSPRTS